MVSEPLLILSRVDESLHHLSNDKAAIKVIQFVQPQLAAGVVHVR